MKKNKLFRFGGSVALVATLVAMSGCGGGGSGGFAAAPPPAPITAVPDSAGVSGASFVAFIMGLALGDETSEPLTFSAAFVDPPEDNVGEPVVLGA